MRACVVGGFGVGAGQVLNACDSCDSCRSYRRLLALPLFEMKEASRPEGIDLGGAG